MLLMFQYRVRVSQSPKNIKIHNKFIMVLWPGMYSNKQVLKEDIFWTISNIQKIKCQSFMGPSLTAENKLK